MHVITGQTKFAGLFAHPARHSLSPQIQNRLFKDCGVDGVYLAFDIVPAELEKAVESLKTLDAFGANLSMPHKEAAPALMDEVSTQVALTGAMNTIIWDGQKLYGESTDGVGFFRALASEKITTAEKTLLIFGGGGAVKSILAAASRFGPAVVQVALRSSAHREATQKELQKIAAATGLHLRFIALEELQELQAAVDAADILINGTNAGMTPHLETSALPEEIHYSSEKAFIDLVYAPLETVFLKRARLKGCRTLNGLAMLLFQGIASFELWTGKSPAASTVEALKKELFEINQKKEN
jgi:shikimate dehydrogenase